MKARLAVLLLACVLAPAVETTVGVEGRIEVTIPGPRLVAAPAAPTDRLWLRIADVAPASGGNRYDLRWQGFEPGSFDLVGQLRQADGSAAAASAIPVTVRSVLPENHRGELSEGEAPVRSALGGYLHLMAGGVVLWLVCALLLAHRRRPSPAPPVPAPATLAQRLHPLVEAACAGTLDSAGLAALERMLLAYWRERLGLSGLPPLQALQRLRDDAQAGELLRQVESWLHARPGSAPKVDIAELLAPYRQATP